jgi:hypothetical protein
VNTAVAVLVGPGHVVAYQSHSAVLLLGLLIGMPIREALVTKDRAFVPIFKLLDDVYATGLSLRVDVLGGVMWLMRVGQGNDLGVGLYYERSRDLSTPSPRLAHPQLVSAE